MKRKIFFSIVAILFAVLLVIMGAVIGMSLQSSNTPATITPGNDNQGIDVGEPNPNTPTDETEDTDTAADEDKTPVESDTTNDYRSERYNIQFRYPKTFGEHIATVNTLYFYNEQVRFPDSKISINYVRTEGSFANDGNNLNSGQVSTKQGYTGNYYIYRNGSKYQLFVRVPSPGTNGTSVTITSESTTEAGAEAELAKVQDILDTLEFDFSNVPLDGCEISCR